MKFHVVEMNEQPVAVFDDEPSPRDWLLSSFLEEVRDRVRLFIAEIERVQNGGVVLGGPTGDGVNIEVEPTRLVIEELYPEDGDEAEPKRLELSLSEARQLLLEWQDALMKWRMQDTTGQERRDRT